MSTGKIIVPLIVVSGSVAPAVAGIGIAQVIHGHSWGYLLIAAGLAASVPYLVGAVRSLRQTSRDMREVGLWPLRQALTTAHDQDASGGES